MQMTIKDAAVLPFYGAGAIFFLILTLLMFVASNRFQDHFFQAQTLALVHAAALGWGTMIIFGAAYQLMPVIFERELYSSKMAFTSFLALFTGSIALVCSFWYFHIGLLMIGSGVLVLIAAILYSINVFKTAGSAKFNVQKLFLMASSIWLIITATVGVLLAINLYKPFISFSHFEILKLHAHIGFVGWFLQLITGVSSLLVPMFLFGKSKKTNLLYLSFAFQNIGLIGFTIDQALWGSSTRALVYFIIIVAGIGCWLIYLRDIYVSRVKKKVDLQMRYTFISKVFLLLAVALVPVVMLVSGNEWSILYGVFIFLGWISAIIFGKTFKTLPFIIWNIHYKKEHGKRNIPLPKQLYSEGLLVYQFWFFIAALFILSFGVLINQLIVIQSGLLLWILVALLYVLNVAKVFLHKKQSDGITN